MVSDRTIEQKRLIARRKKGFLALVLTAVLGLAPTVNVLAEDLEFRDLDYNRNANGYSLKTDESIKWDLGNLTTGKLRVIYYDAAGKKLKTVDDAQAAAERIREVVLENCDIADLDRWKVFDYKKFDDRTAYSADDVLEDRPTYRYISEGGGCFRLIVKLKAVVGTVASSDEKKKIRPHSDENSSSHEDDVVAVHNPFALDCRYYKNGILQYNALIGRQEQSELAKAVFSSAVPLGWKEAFSMSMSLNGKNEYSLKDGTIVLRVPSEYRKTGREFAILAMDNEGKVHVLADLDKDPDTVTVVPNIRGYAYVLIYKD